MTTAAALLRRWRDALARSGVAEAALESELLYCEVTGHRRAERLFWLEETPAAEAVRRGESMLARRCRREPLYYIFGHASFRDLELTVSPAVLIPRPETELLVDLLLEHTPRGGRILDVGTGSGCIILSLAREMSDGIFLGIDISADAVSLAQENAVRCGLADRVNFAVADGLDEFDEPGMVDILVSNPPYIPSSECATLDPRIRNWEPMNALDGGAAGLDFYERLVGDALNILKPSGGAFLEIGDGQGEALRKLFFDAGFDDIRIEKDYAGHDRYAFAVLP